MKFVATKPVSIFWQIAFVFVIDVFAFYRIQKLRRYLLIVVLPIAVIATIIASIFTDFNCVQDWWIVIGYDTCLSFEMNVAIQLIYGFILVYSIYLIRKWSLQWNKQYEV